MFQYIYHYAHNMYVSSSMYKLVFSMSSGEMFAEMICASLVNDTRFQ